MYDGERKEFIVDDKNRTKPRDRSSRMGLTRLGPKMRTKKVE